MLPPAAPALPMLAAFTPMLPPPVAAATPTIRRAAATLPLSADGEFHFVDATLPPRRPFAMPLLSPCRRDAAALRCRDVADITAAYYGAMLASARRDY